MTSIASENAVATESTPYARLVERARRIRLLGGCQSLLGWDQETYMPSGGIGNRGEQLALLATMSHEMFTDPAVGEWLDACEADDDLTADSLSVEAVNLREIRRDYDRATK
ncbi:MAG: hypothetical protein MI741_21480, partial [Rhodospirillales bacterium]|nr:hypothetical protein [Rhodospirillales bacterium]